MPLVTRAFLVPAFVIAVLSVASPAAAQSTDRKFEVGAHIAIAGSDQFDETDTGFGGRFAWLPMNMLGIEAEVSLYPSDYPDNVPFSSARWEAFFGGTFGPRLGRVRPFGKIRPGFLSYREAPEPFACIAIFPPPLHCTLGAGRTILALDIGGGIDVAISERSFARVDVSDRALRYEGPVFDATFTPREESFWRHGFRISAGGGLRF